MRVLFLVPYPVGCAPSQRFRFEQYLGELEKNQITYNIKPFLTQKAWNGFYRKGNFISKSIAVLGGLARRYTSLFSLRKYDIVFVHRETTPVGPGVFQWLMIKVFRTRVIYDFDDAVWLPNSSSENESFAWAKSHRRALYLMKHSWKNACGNQYLTQFAAERNPNSFFLPTTVDTDRHHFKVPAIDRQTTIGWTGSHSTIKYLDEIIPELKALRNEFDFRLLVISDAPPEFELDNMDFIPWNADTEVSDLQQMDIGLMPLHDDQWTKGKCSLKALQYMATGIVAVVSPVGANKDIVTPGVNGHFAGDGQWARVLSEVMKNMQAQEAIVRSARTLAEQRYSTAANRGEFLALLTH